MQITAARVFKKFKFVLKILEILKFRRRNLKNFINFIKFADQNFKIFTVQKSEFLKILL